MKLLTGELQPQRGTVVRPTYEECTTPLVS